MKISPEPKITLKLIYNLVVQVSERLDKVEIELQTQKNLIVQIVNRLDNIVKLNNLKE